MNKRSKWIMVSTIISTMLMGSISPASTFTDSLIKYCVPINGNVCTGDVKATYNSTLTGANKCECQREGMYYDASVGVRYCKTCPDGTITGTAKNLTACKAIQCPSGYKLVKISKGACPSGYRLTQVSSGKCPSGYKVYEYK